MCEKRILLASLLKPVDDTRMYEKLGLSLSKMENVQVHIAGFAAPIPQDAPVNITFHPLFEFKRISIDRIKAQLDYWRLLLRIKPDLVIVGTHELLVASVLFTKSNKCRLIYDIRENYCLNLLSQRHYSFGIRQVLSSGVHFSETMAASTISHFLLAERSYAKELHFLENRFTIIENKFKPHPGYATPPTPVQVVQDQLRLLYSGTIASLYGIFEAILLTDKLHQSNHNVSLTIIGYCASEETLLKLLQEIKGKPYITLIGGNKLVPHKQIIEAIKRSDVGLMPYRYNESTFNCIPTKLYEYVAMGLPVLIQQNPLWDNIISAYDAGLPINYKEIDISHLMPILLNKTFYLNGIPDNVFWASEDQKLIPIVTHNLHQ